MNNSDNDPKGTICIHLLLLSKIIQRQKTLLEVYFTTKQWILREFGRKVKCEFCGSNFTLGVLVGPKLMLGSWGKQLKGRFCVSIDSFM